MALKLYNTLTKKKEEFKPINPGKVGMYVCGPTVYDYIHIGNIRSYLMSDTARRYLEHLGYEVRMIKNITDVGHLTEDDIGQGDSGEDKFLKKSLVEKKTPAEIAKFYEEYFHSTEDEMNILPAHFFPRATAHIPQMIKIISTLIEKGCAYEKNGNVFFDVTSFPNYGKLSGNTLENLKVGARLEEHPDKKNPWDFALWLKAPKGHILKWESPWSLGYPGWHIECSAMSTEYLGDTIDIHTGGEDNIFPHHEAEIAQTECATGKKFVNYWLHVRHLMVDYAKMSKSKSNFYTLDDILHKDNFDNPMFLRLLILSSHYRSQMNFTWESLDQARINFTRLKLFNDELERLLSINKPPLSNTECPILDLNKYKKEFEDAMDDDLNTPLALAATRNFISEFNKKWPKLSEKESKEIYNFWLKVKNIFGLIFPIDNVVPKEITEIAEERKAARQNKNFKASDDLRDKITELGYTIEDLKDNNYLIKPAR